jgi:drug/metabolite transporter (DMT)-like permease
MCRPFKPHQVVDLGRDWRGERKKKLRYLTRRALAAQRVGPVENPGDYATLLWKFYRRTIDRFGLTGICLVFWPEVIALDKAHNIGLAVLLGVIATYFASLGSIISVHNQKSGIQVISGNAFGMLYGTALMTLYALISGVHFNFDPSFGYVSSLMYLSLFGSALAFTLYLTLVGQIGPEKAAYATVLFPIVALTLSTLFENYRWNVLAGVGVLLVLVGNVIVLTNRRQFRILLNRLNLPLP